MYNVIYFSFLKFASLLGCDEENCGRKINPCFSLEHSVMLSSCGLPCFPCFSLFSFFRVFRLSYLCFRVVPTVVLIVVPVTTARIEKADARTNTKKRVSCSVVAFLSLRCLLFVVLETGGKEHAPRFEWYKHDTECDVRSKTRQQKRRGPNVGDGHFATCAI